MAKRKKLYIESYGCQMNVSDSEIVTSILQDHGFDQTATEQEADLVLLNTCSIRDNAEQRIRNRLRQIKGDNKIKTPKIGILGCMAERLKSKLLEEEKLVDLVVGPDAYRDLPNILLDIDDGKKAVNVLLSREETYADISPVRLNSNGVNALISIMRGCDNMCSFCVVPFTRGRERSRDPLSIEKEALNLFENGYREITLLGQNVDSYRWNMDRKGGIKDPKQASCNFAHLLERVAKVNPELRVRFSTSHPKDMSDEVLHTIAKYENICNYIHLPVQSGDDEILEKMNRGYTRAWYLKRIKAIREIIPNCAISSDFITGFCGESDRQHQQTLDLMKEVAFDFAYMFKYSERPNTLAERKFKDDVPEEVKSKRLTEIIALQKSHSLKINQSHIGKTYQVLIEGYSKKSKTDYHGRMSQNAVVIFPIPENKKIGEYVDVTITSCSSATLLGIAKPE